MRGYGPLVEIVAANADAATRRPGEAAASPPDWVQVVPPGLVHGVVDFVMDEAAARETLAAFNARRVDPVVDYVHQTLLLENAAGGAPAAGWFKELDWRGMAAPSGGLWGRIDWTANGGEDVAAKRYRYLSPVVAYDPTSKRVRRLLAAALTNVPAIDELLPLSNAGLDPCAAGEEVPMRDKLKAALGLAPEASDDELMKGMQAAMGQIAPQHVAANAAVAVERDALRAERDKLAGELKTANERIAANAAVLADRDSLAKRLALVEGQLADQAAAELVAANAAKISPALREWATAFAKRDPAAFGLWAKDAPELPSGLRIAANAAPAGVLANVLDAKDAAGRDKQVRDLVRAEIAANANLSVREALAVVAGKRPELFADLAVARPAGNVVGGVAT